MAGHSATRKLGEVVTFRGGGTPSTERAEFWEGDIPWVSPKDMKFDLISDAEDKISEAAIAGSATNFIPTGACLVVVRSGILARTVPVGLTAREVAINQDIKALCPSAVIAPKYLFYFLKSAEPALLRKVTRGATVHRLATDDLRDLSIPLPPLAEQKRIVAILDEAFEGIAKATENVERNLANARELPDALLDAALADRDGTWVETTLGAIAEFKNGLNFTKASKGETIRIVGVKDFQNEYWILEEGLDTVTIDGRLAPSYELRSGDILTVRSNGNKKLIGRCMIAAGVPEKTSHSGFTIRIRISDERVAPQFLAHVLKSRSARAELVASGGGANISSLNQQALTDLPIAFPSMAEQERILARIESLMSGATQLAETCRLKLGSLAELKQSLLHKAFSGQLKEAIAA